MAENINSKQAKEKLVKVNLAIKQLVESKTKTN
jgi:hypothetical protein